MKEILNYMAITLVSVAVSISVGMAIILVTDNERFGLSVMFFGGILIALMLGAFNEK